jgi:hypothetical protein
MAAQFYQERPITQDTSAMKKPYYIEGPKAQEKFERGMKALFQVPKTLVSGCTRSASLS